MSEDEAVGFEENGEELVVDLSSVEDAGFELIPKGAYPCEITNCEFTHSQSKGTPMWAMEVTLTGDGEFSGRKLFTYMVWAGKGLPMTKRTVAQALPELLENPFKPDDEDLLEALLGRPLTVRVGVQMYRPEGEKLSDMMIVV